MPALTPGEDSYNLKVMRTFLVDGRIKQIPVQSMKREVILRYLIPNFEARRVYREMRQGYGGRRCRSFLDAMWWLGPGSLTFQSPHDAGAVSGQRDCSAWMCWTT